MLPLLAVAAAYAGLAPLPSGQSHYTESCGGCHGLLGVSARNEIPVLRDRVGVLLCTREGRGYVVRLPNVAFARMDDATLAEALNFMMFGLGGRSLPPPGTANAQPFTAREVHELRTHPMKASDLYGLRAAALAGAKADCLARAGG